jgi:crotonobetainyl-CoA:carnitine CoA-transferase CaiB-like acyl-CoA transferase
MKNALLSGLRVIDLSAELAWDCGRILASYGAEVIRVDLPAAAVADTAATLAWRIGHADKHCAAIDYTSPAGRDVLMQLIGTADVLIESFATEALQRHALHYEQLRALYPQLIVVSISPFGRTGPLAHYRGGELVVSAMSGILSTCGDADRPPVREPGNANWFHACAAGALGAVMAVHHRRAGGSGQWVDISAQEMGAARNTTWVIAHQFDGKAVQRNGPNFGATRGIWKVKDGYVAFALMGGKFGGPANKALSDWMDELGYDNPIKDVDWEKFMVQDVTDAMRARWIPPLDAFFADRTRAEFATEGRRRGITATPLAEPGETLQDPQLAARGYFGSPHDTTRGSVRLPEYFIRSSCDDASTVRMPTTIGCDGMAPERPSREAVRAAPDATSTPVQPPAPLPLAGLKVLDFSWAIVGGTTAKLLGDFGAEVIKIESHKRLGLERLSNTSKVSKAGNLDDKPWFAHVNTSKQSFVLNLAEAGSRPIVESLVRWADVVLENFSPGTMDKLGLGYEALRALKPDIIMASGSVFGQTGPQRHFWGVDSTGAAASGRMFMTGWQDRGPVLPSAPYGDCLLPYFLATGMIAAVDYRQRTGHGCHIDGSMLEVLVQQMLPAVIDQQLRGGHAQRHGNGGGHGSGSGSGKLDGGLQGVFPCRGDERWIAIEATTAAEQQSLARVLAIATAELSALEQQTRQRDAYELMAELQTAGVAAGVVQFAGDTIDRDPQLRARGFLQAVDHPLLGAFPHQASPVRLSATPQRMRPAPRIGEHTRAICRDALKQDDATIDGLERDKVLW